MIETVDFTLEDLAAMLRTVAAERPDYVYRRPDADSICLYVHDDGEPGCIFGVAFRRLGIDIVALGNHGPVTYLLERWFGNGVGCADVYRAFQRVQGDQDTGTTWGNAVKWLDERYPL